MSSRLAVGSQQPPAQLPASHAATPSLGHPPPLSDQDHAAKLEEHVESGATDAGAFDWAGDEEQPAADGHAFGLDFDDPVQNSRLDTPDYSCAIPFGQRPTLNALSRRLPSPPLGVPASTPPIIPVNTHGEDSMDAPSVARVYPQGGTYSIWRSNVMNCG
jgi:hypothetical protein